MPGAKRGFYCAFCAVEVQISKEGQTYLALGGVPLCNRCAEPMLRRAQNVMLSPTAARQMGEDPQRYKARKTATCDCCLRETDRLWVYANRGVCPYPRTRRMEFEVQAGEWALCVFCNVLYKAGEIDNLIARVVVLNPTMDTLALTRVYRLLPDIFYGPGKVWDVE